MEYATLNNGIKMPMAGIGTFLLTPDEAEASVLSALSCGYRLIDTANAYVNEKAVGRAMKKSGLPREEIFLETKLWPAFYEQPDAVEKTLDRLGTGYIDLLLIHQPAGNYIAGYKLMEKACKEGKVKAIGLSNFTVEQTQEILNICEVKPAVLQTEVHPYSQEKELKRSLKKEGIVIQAWYPLGHGDKALIQEPAFAKLAKKYESPMPRSFCGGIFRTATSLYPVLRILPISKTISTCSTSLFPRRKWRRSLQWIRKSATIPARRSC